MIQDLTWQECRDEIAEMIERYPHSWTAEQVKVGGLNRVTDVQMLRYPEINLRHWYGDEEVKDAVYRLREAWTDVLEAMGKRLRE